MKLALFDLDHTLIPFDSGMAWTQFLVARGVLPADAEARHLAFCEQYVDGTLDIHAMHRASFAPLADVPIDELAVWFAEFEASIAPSVPEAARALVARHRKAGDVCALVTATSRLIAEPFARIVGLVHVVATESQIANGRVTGKIAGEPCFREHKISHVDHWLAHQGRGRGDFTESWFYSDSASDLPLLEAVTHPVTVNPDARLRLRASEASWPVLTLT